MKMTNIIITHAQELLTLRGASDRPKLREELADLGIIEDGALAIRNGKIIAMGSSEEIEQLRGTRTQLIDASGKVVMPGFVDCHTHLVFAGWREDEFVQKIRGKTYLEILREGGGILSTVRATRRASPDRLFQQAKLALDVMLRLGTTTVEAKSGYGLDVKNELKCLEVIRALDRAHPVKLVPTFLGAHAIPPRFVRNKEGYVRLVREQMLPRVAKRELARYCDVFCEAGAFSTDDARDILKAAQRVGMGLKLHADELSYTGGAELAAELGATSADHLDHISREGIEAMARVGVIGVLLPGVPFHLMTERYAPARRMISSGVAIALATDYNPGSCPIPSMQFILSLACRRLKLTPAQAIAAATINAAHAVGLAKEVGSLEVGKLADVIILDVPNHRHIPYHLARNLVSTVIKGGKIV